MAQSFVARVVADITLHSNSWRKYENRSTLPHLYSLRHAQRPSWRLQRPCLPSANHNGATQRRRNTRKISLRLRGRSWRKLRALDWKEIWAINTNNSMTRFYKLSNGSIFRYHGVMMLKRSAFQAATNSHILGRRKPLHVFMWPFSKVEVVKKIIWSI